MSYERYSAGFMPKSTCSSLYEELEEAGFDTTDAMINQVLIKQNSQGVGYNIVFLKKSVPFTEQDPVVAAVDAKKSKFIENLDLPSIGYSIDGVFKKTLQDVTVKLDADKPYELSLKYQMITKTD